MSLRLTRQAWFVVLRRERIKMKRENQTLQIKGDRCDDTGKND
jgi:hypothetical protein